MEKKPLNRVIKTFYGCGELGFTLMTNVELYLFVFFMTNVAKWSLATVATVGFITSMADSLLSPVYGAFITRFKALKWGRNRSWILLLTVPAVIFYTFQFSNIGPEPVAATIVTIAYILAHIAFSTSNAAHISLVSVLATNDGERAILASRRGTWTAVAGILYSYLGTPLAAFYAVQLGTNGYTELALTMGLLWAALYLFTFKITEGYEPVDEAENTDKAKRVTILDMVKSLVQNPPLISLVFADFLRYTANFTLVASLTYYFVYVAGESMMPLYFILGGISQVIGAFIAGMLSNKLSSRTTTILSMAGVGLFELLAWFTGMIPWACFAALMCYRFFHGMGISTYVALYSDTVIYAQWKTGKNAAPFIMGLMNLAIKFATSARSLIVPAILAAVNFNSEIAPAAATMEFKQGVVTMFLLVPALLTLAAGAVLIIFYKLTRKKLLTYQSEIDARLSMA